MAGYYIDAAMLRKRGACDEQIELFVQTFGEGRVLVNLANVKKAMAAGLDVKWPATDPWTQCGFGTKADTESHALRFRAYDANTPREILACLKAAPRIWQMIDAERATGGHRQWLPNAWGMGGRRFRWSARPARPRTIPA